MLLHYSPQRFYSVPAPFYSTSNLRFFELAPVGEVEPGLYLQAEIWLLAGTRKVANEILDRERAGFVCNIVGKILSFATLMRSRETHIYLTDYLPYLSRS